MTLISGDSCLCSVKATVTLEWSCPRGHAAYAALCQSHAAIHVAVLLNGDMRCGRCRNQEGKEVAVTLRRVNGKRVSPRQQAS